MHKAITLSYSCGTYMSNHPKSTYLESLIKQCPILSTLKKECLKKVWYDAWHASIWKEIDFGNRFEENIWKKIWKLKTWKRLWNKKLENGCGENRNLKNVMK